MTTLKRLSKELCIKLCYEMWRDIVTELKNLEKSPVLRKMRKADNGISPGAPLDVFPGSKLISELKHFTRSKEFASRLNSHSNCAACLYTQQISRHPNYLECDKCFLNSLWNPSGAGMLIACEFGDTSPYKILREQVIEEFGDKGHKRMIQEAERIVAYCVELLNQTEEAVNGRR